MNIVCNSLILHLEVIEFLHILILGKSFVLESCFYIFNRAPHYMLHLLAPMFEMDYLLPRSFVAVLNIERFESTVCEKKFPMDVVLTGIHTFLKTDITFKTDKVKNKMVKIKIMDKSKNIMKVKTVYCFSKHNRTHNTQNVPVLHMKQLWIISNSNNVHIIINMHFNI